MGAESGFFLSPFLLKEMFDWSRANGENLLVFEPIAKACAGAASALANTDEQCRLIRENLERWCSSADFEEAVASCVVRGRNLWLDQACRNFAESTGVHAELAGIPVNRILTAFSALIRSELRLKDSRSSAHIDELFIWQSDYDYLGHDDVCLWVMCHLLAGSGSEVFDRLLELRRARAEFHVASPGPECIDVRLHLAAGLGHAAFGRFAEAKAVFGRALQNLELADSDMERLQTGMALSAFMSGDAAAHRALTVQTSSADYLQAAQILTMASQSCGLSRGLDLPNAAGLPLSENSRLGRQVLGFMHMKQGRYTEALQLLTPDLNADSSMSCPQAELSSVVELLLCSQCLIMQYRDAHFQDPPVPGAVGSIEHKLAFEQARSFLAMAESTAAAEGYRGLRDIARINLSAVHCLLRQFSAAVAQSNLLLEDKPDCSKAIFNKCRALLAAGMLPELEQSVQHLRGSDAIAAGRMLADACYHAGDFVEALRLWDELLDHDPDRMWRMRETIRKLEVYRMLRKQPQAQECIDELIQRFTCEPEARFALGSELAAIGQGAEALNLLIEAKDAAPKNLAGWISWELGRLYCQLGKVLSATDEYACISNPEIDSVQSREFAVALFRAGFTPAAHQNAKKLRLSSGQIIPGISEIEADFLIKNGELEQARQLLESLAAVRPLSVANRIALVQLYIELDKNELALAEVLQLKSLRLSDSLESQVLLLEQRIRAGGISVS